jgi:hypothetical protein
VSFTDSFGYELAVCEMTTREDVHRLVDQVPESNVEAAAAHLRHLGSEPDDEELTPEELAEIYEAKAQMVRGEHVTPYAL